MQLHQNIVVRLSLAFLVIFAFASCITDSYTDDAKDSSGITSGDRVYTFLFQIDTGDIATRATEGNDDSNAESGEHVNGSDTEHSIGSSGNYIFFFNEDKDNTFHSYSELTLTTPASSLWGDDHKEHDVEYVYAAQISAGDEEDEASSLPNNIQCIILLNGEGIYSQLAEAAKEGLDNFLTTLWGDNSSDIGYNTDGRL